MAIIPTNAATPSNAVIRTNMEINPTNVAAPTNVVIQTVAAVPTNMALESGKPNPELKYDPLKDPHLILGMMGAALLVIIIVSTVVYCYCCRGRRKKSKAPAAKIEEA